jgi:hypothetical protein
MIDARRCLLRVPGGSVKSLCYTSDTPFTEYPVDGNHRYQSAPNQTNPSLLGQTLDRGEYLLITRRGKPIGIAAAFDDTLLDLGFRKWIAVRSFQSGDLSLARWRGCSRSRAKMMMGLLGELGVPIADYDLAEELETPGSAWPSLE